MPWLSGHDKTHSNILTERGIRVDTEGTGHKKRGKLTITYSFAPEDVVDASTDNYTVICYTLNKLVEIG
jgi:hypothetical protein